MLTQQCCLVASAHQYWMYSAWSFVQGLNVGDLEDLLEDIEVYRTIEKDTNLEFWKVCSMYVYMYHMHVHMYMQIV